MSKQYGHIVEVDLRRKDANAAIPEAVYESVYKVITAATEEPGMQIDYGTLKVEVLCSPSMQCLRVYAKAETRPRMYTLEERKDLQVDMIRAIRGIDRNGNST